MSPFKHPPTYFAEVKPATDHFVVIPKFMIFFFFLYIKLDCFGNKSAFSRALLKVF